MEHIRNCFGQCIDYGRNVYIAVLAMPRHLPTDSPAVAARTMCHDTISYPSRFRRARTVSSIGPSPLKQKAEHGETYAMPFSESGEVRQEITAQELGALLSGIDLRQAKRRKRYRRTVSEAA